MKSLSPQPGHAAVSRCLSVVALGALVFALLGCPLPVIDRIGEPEPDAPNVINEPVACERSLDCDRGEICRREDDAPFGICDRVICEQDDHCAEGESCDVERGVCFVPLACVPSSGVGCAAAERCLVQDNAARCVALTELPVPTACELSLDRYVLRDGATMDLQILGLDRGALVPFGTFFFASDVGSIVNGRLTGVCEASAPCVGTLTVFNQAQDICGEVEVIVHPAIPPTDVRVVVLDALTSNPVAATIALRTTGNAELSMMQTDAFGAATFANLDPNTVEFASAFSDTHTWATYASPSTNDLVMFVDASRDQSRGAGVKGVADSEFFEEGAFSFGDVALALSGTPLRASGTELELHDVGGAGLVTEVALDGLTPGPIPWDFPAGMEMRLVEEPLKADFIARGTPGDTLVWSTSGRAQIAALGFLFAPDDARLIEGALLKVVLRQAKTFEHGVLSNVTLVEQPLPPVEVPRRFDDWPFEEVAPRANTHTTEKTVFTVPPLPCAPGEAITADCTRSVDVVSVAGVLIPNRGVVPLGLSTASDGEEPNGTITEEGDTVYREGDTAVFLAPPHDGLEGHLVVDLAFAATLDRFGASRPETSAITRIGETRGDTTTFVNTFLAHPQGEYERSSGDLNAPLPTNAAFSRARFSDATGEWDIYFPAGATVNTNALLPAEFFGRTSELTLKAFAFGTGYAGSTATSYEELIGFNGADLNQSLFSVGAWASSVCRTSAINGGCLLSD